MVTKAKGSKKVPAPPHLKENRPKPTADETLNKVHLELALEVQRKFNEKFKGHEPVSFLAALEMLTNPEHIKSNYITLLKKRLENQGGEAKVIVAPDSLMSPEEVEHLASRHGGKPHFDPRLDPPVDISDVPDKPTDLDMWQDRSNKMICGSCMNYLDKGHDVFGQAIGACKHDAPTMKGYPRVYEDEPGCGAHKMRVITQTMTNL